MAIKLVIKVEDYGKGAFQHLLVDAVMLFPICNVQHFVHRNLAFGQYWAVSEYESGAQAGYGWSVEGAISKALHNINGIGEEEYRKVLENFIASYGKANFDPVPSFDTRSYSEIENELNELYAIEHKEPDPLFDTTTTN